MLQEKVTITNIPTTFNRAMLRILFSVNRVRLSSKENLILIITSIALAQTLLHLLAINAYGFHEDELLYMVLGDHLAWGYQETGPLIAVIGNFSKWIFGDSLVAMRIIPALCAGAIVHLTGLLTIRLGGKHFAVIIACTTIAFSPAFLATGALFIPQVFDELFWIFTAYLMVCWVQKPKDSYLLWLGMVIAFGVLLKYTLLLYVGGILIGLACTPNCRSIFKNKALYFSILIGLSLLLPHIIWQLENGFPAIIHYNELKKTQLNYLYRIDLLIQQLLVNGIGVVVWLFGIFTIFYIKKLKQFRFIAISFLLVVAALILLKGKPYYAFGAYPALFAAGAIGLEKLISKTSLNRKLLFAVVLILPNLLLSIIVLPILPIKTASTVFGWARNNLGITFTVKWEDQKIHAVNQNFADMIGWDELAKKTSILYLSLPARDRAKTIIYTENYGIASALSYYSKRYPLPKVVSLNGSFALWAPKNVDNRFIISYVSIENISASKNIDLATKYVVNNEFSRLFGTQIFLAHDRNFVFIANTVKARVITRENATQFKNE